MKYKFRGKRKDNGEWVYGDLSNEYDGSRFISYWTSECTDASVNLWEPVQKSYEIIPVTVGMWTGMKDKNGVDIYEGDTLKGFQREQCDKEGKYGFDITDTVHWRNGGFKAFGKCLQDGYTRDNNILYQFMWCSPASHVGKDHYYQIDDIEVIGNIHDVNPAGGQSSVSNMLHDPNQQQQESAGEAAEVANEQATQDQAPESAEEKAAEE